MKITKVFLRSKDISKGRQTLYLDFYPAIPHPETGKPTRREFLGLYVYRRPRTAEETQHNKEAKALAERIRAQRQLDIQAAQAGQVPAARLNADFVAWFAANAQARAGKAATRESWQTALAHLQRFWPSGIPFREMNKAQAEAFRAYLENSGLAHNSQSHYFSKFRAGLKQAYRAGYLPNDITAHFDAIPLKETRKSFVTLDELQALAKAECSRPELKAAFLFSALTGLRYSDIYSLAWPQVKGSSESGWALEFRQKKTGGVEYLPIPSPARELMGQARQEGKVFPLSATKLSGWDNGQLREWFAAAGIGKKLSFHSARHSFATIQLTLGTDLYTVSKLLGHKSISTTQVYGKIVDAKKKAATDKLNGFEL